ncbi:GNAT family N-acetyltransferase [Jannaschia sp. KMU-145]|uniref:GNAT family N-acetyltransferase n=1 Tax=Jannaschia halovivens TaxID=3388667 RepID=UPI00396B047B
MTVCRRMTLPELRLVLDWAAAEGWNPGHDDAEAFWAADPDGFFVAEADGAPVAAISVVNHSAAFAFLGLYICRPSHRGRGIGLALWTHALAHAGNRIVGLDGVPDQQANYARSGFVAAGGAMRHVGRIDGQRSDRIGPARPDDIAALLDLEARASGWGKPVYMAAWFTDAPTRHTFVLRDGGAIRGVATRRACRVGVKVGPLIAPDDATAMELLAHVAGSDDVEITVDVPLAAETFAARCSAEGMVAGFQTARMYRGLVPAMRRGLEVSFGATSLELG